MVTKTFLNGSLMTRKAGWIGQELIRLTGGLLGTQVKEIQEINFEVENGIFIGSEIKSGWIIIVEEKDGTHTSEQYVQLDEDTIWKVGSFGTIGRAPLYCEEK